MNSKNRVMQACNHIQPDKVPIDFWATSTSTKKIIQNFGCENKDDFLDTFGFDLRYISGPAYIGSPLKSFSDGSKEDIWGVHRIKKATDSGANYSHVTKYPLAEAETLKDIENYTHWPSADSYDFSSIQAQCNKYKEKAIVFSGGRLNRTSQLKAAIYLRGMQNVMEDMYFSPGLLEGILEHITNFYLEYNKRIFEAANGKIDIFMMGDDFGMQNSLICSKELWQKFFEPGLRKFIALAKNYGIKVMHHSCGAIDPLIPNLIDLGLDILNPIQPEASGMAPEKIKKEYGADITLHGTVSIQKTLPYGSPQDVKDEIATRVETLSKNGGVILCSAHNLQDDVPMRNIEALLEAYKEYR